MKKSKLFKTISFSSLALLMGIAGTMAFAPLGATPNNLANASEMVDQINTKADGENIKYAQSPLGLDPENDPVIYTTESGLEIKYGGAGLPSGPLTGYPYITMGTYNNYAVNWVIIGMPSSAFNPIQTLPQLSSFPNIFENTTPAGQVITNETPLHNFLLTKPNLSSTVTISSSPEIDGGCVLVISESTLGSTAFRNSGKYEGSTLKAAIDNLYTSGLGLTESQKNLIKSTTVKSWYVSALYNSTCYMFPLGAHETYNENFHFHSYLTTNALRQCYAIGTTTLSTWWSRSSHSNTSGYGTPVQTSGEPYWGGSSSIHVQGTSNGIRPACVIKLA